MSAVACGTWREQQQRTTEEIETEENVCLDFTGECLFIIMINIFIQTSE